MSGSEKQIKESNYWAVGNAWHRAYSDDLENRNQMPYSMPYAPGLSAMLFAI
jgi:hypothetical protein